MMTWEDPESTARKAEVDAKIEEILRKSYDENKTPLRFYPGRINMVGFVMMLVAFFAGAFWDTEWGMAVTLGVGLIGFILVIGDWRPWWRK